MATLTSDGERSQKQLGVVFIAHGFALLRNREEVIDVQREQSWTENGPFEPHLLSVVYVLCFLGRCNVIPLHIVGTIDRMDGCDIYCA